jgi:hypothetical protein
VSRRRWSLLFPLLTAAVVLAVAAPVVWPAAEPENEEPPDFAHPTRHFPVPDPAALSDPEAVTIYDAVRDDMLAAYRLSGDPVAMNYWKWRRYNRVPYRSRPHGERYVNHYANAKADAYGRAGDIGELPAGAVVVKDAFTVTARGDVFVGPLFIMEKMLPGFSHATRNWRYTMIMPDGSLFGTTNGDGHERVEFCAHCHAAAGDGNDHLFFVPAEYRLRFLLLDR